MIKKRHFVRLDVRTGDVAYFSFTGKKKEFRRFLDKMNNKDFGFFQYASKERKIN